MNRLKRKYYHWLADVHCLSYPKCGRTWLRLMIGTLLQEHFGVDTQNLHQTHKLANRRRGIPCVYFRHDWCAASNSGEAPTLEREKSRFAGRKVLLLIRDPRDVVVSNYFGEKYRANSFTGDIKLFIRDPFHGIHNIVDYYSIWAHERSRPSDFAIIRYEDLHGDTSRELRRVVDYCGLVNISNEHIDEVAQRFSFDRMQRMERRGEFSAKIIRPRDIEDPSTYKTRSGRVGGYADYLDDSDTEYMEGVIRRRLDPWYKSYHSPGASTGPGPRHSSSPSAET